MPRTTSCPSCGAALRADAPWCTLCYTNLRPKPAPEPAPAGAPLTAPPTALYGEPSADPLTQPLIDLLPRAETPVAAEPTWPCSLCDALNPLVDTHCGTCGKPFLAAVQQEQAPLLVLPVIGDISRFGRGQRAGLALAAVAAVLAPLALITLLLTGRPPQSATTTIVPSAPVTTAAP
jgi:ribosomal protein L40E